MRARDVRGFNGQRRIEKILEKNLWKRSRK